MLEQGHRVMNVDLTPLHHPGVDNLTADITDSGQMFNAMSMYAGFDEMEPGTGVPAFDAVVHFAAVPRILIKPDNETFRVNTVGTYNVIEAAVKLGIKKIIIASSETTYGICFSDGKTDPKYLPLDEHYDVDPMDSYGLSKVVNEQTARSFQRRTGVDIYALRIGNVIEPHEYETLFPYYFKHPEVRRRNAFCYIDARDLGQIVDLCLQKDGLGYQVFNAGNDHNGAIIPSRELAERFFPGVPLTRELEEHEALFSNRKIREVLGFKEQHNWRKYVKGE
nr:NAD(P)-dependent oxidoreductase [Algoriphagus sp. AK58]